MATLEYTIHPLAGAERFRVNDWTPFATTDSSILFEQAHGMLSVITSSNSREIEAEVGPLNRAITESALHGVLTLLGLGILASDNENRARQVRMDLEQ